MLHHILAKYNDQVTDKAALLPQITALFEQLLAMPGIHCVAVRPNVIHRPNRYDLMIVIDMDESALAAYDASEYHHQWKETYGPLLAQKAIFDCDGSLT